jgi:hypothetical protein
MSGSSSGFQTAILAPYFAAESVFGASCGGRLLVVRPRLPVPVAAELAAEPVRDVARRAAPGFTRFVAGETLEDALAVGRKLKAEGIDLTLDRLGESVTSLDEAAAARDEYLGVLDVPAPIRREG